ncbi:hypothetical protein DNTS_015972 [Danionella cerebrum]|uniref:Uncharacterized protein n=1 Tax=Danionella cerebrum TaxID=2873325 RepID=A0A553QE12_9TELE|nr:hypothetical protein DNTS_015972 [Danionella translucida]
MGGVLFSALDLMGLKPLWVADAIVEQRGGCSTRNHIQPELCKLRPSDDRRPSCSSSPQRSTGLMQLHAALPSPPFFALQHSINSLAPLRRLFDAEVAGTPAASTSSFGLCSSAVEFLSIDSFPATTLLDSSFRQVLLEALQIPSLPGPSLHYGLARDPRDTRENLQTPATKFVDKQKHCGEP